MLNNVWTEKKNSAKIQLNENIIGIPVDHLSILSINWVTLESMAHAYVANHFSGEHKNHHDA